MLRSPPEVCHRPEPALASLMRTPMRGRTPWARACSMISLSSLNFLDHRE